MAFTIPGIPSDALVPVGQFTPSHAYPGIDRGVCPPEAILRSLFTWTNVWWVSFYLGYKSYNAKTLSMLNSIGLGTIPIFFGRQPHGYCKGMLEFLKRNNPAKAAKYDLQAHQQREEIHGKAAECRELGQLSGLAAANSARAAGFPHGTTIYLDCEVSTTDPNWVEYFDGYIDSVTALHNSYRPGIYCSSNVAFLAFLTKREELLQKRKDPTQRFNPPIWVYDPKMIGQNKVYTHHKAANGKSTTIAKPKTYSAPFPEFSPRLSHPQAAASQFAQECVLEWNELSLVHGKEKLIHKKFDNVDLNTSIFRDPSQGAAGNRGVFGEIVDKKMYNLSRLYDAARRGVESVEQEVESVEQEIEQLFRRR